MTDKIMICTNYASSSIHIHKRVTKKGVYTSIEHYEGIKRINTYGYFTDQELENVIKNIEEKKNNFYTLLSINKSEITPDIVKHFRYIEPTIEYVEQSLSIEPYILGLWLGDGHSDGASLTNIDLSIIDAWVTYGIKIGCKITESKPILRKTDVKIDETPYIKSYCVVKIPGKNGEKNILKKKLREYDLIKNKHIPIEYLYNTSDNRLLLLAGLIDTDGSFNKQCYEIVQKNVQLSKDIIQLSRSLGFYTRFTIEEKSCTYKGEKKTGQYYRIIISLNQFSKEIPVLLNRKKWKYDPLIHKAVCNPFIDLYGNALVRNKTKWTEEMKIKLYNITKKIKQMRPDRLVPWSKYHEFDVQFEGISPRALDTMYTKRLSNQKEKYDNLVCDINVELIGKWSM